MKITRTCGAGMIFTPFLDLEMLCDKVFKKYATLPKVKFCRMGNNSRLSCYSFLQLSV
jgi:hypothetical protein